MYPASYTNTHHDVIGLVNQRMVKNSKTWISWKRNITFLRNKKNLNLCLKWYILTSYRFVAEVTLKFTIDIRWVLYALILTNSKSQYFVCLCKGNPNHKYWCLISYSYQYCLKLINFTNGNFVQLTRKCDKCIIFHIDFPKYSKKLILSQHVSFMKYHNQRT